MIDFLKDLLKIGLGAILKVSIFFGVGTVGAAIVCWYYGIPLVLSFRTLLISDIKSAIKRIHGAI